MMASHHTYRRTIFFSALILIFTALSPERLNAQKPNDNKPELVGTWSGSMITTYGGKQESSPVEIGFDGSSTVVVKAPGIQVGTYKLKGNDIVIDFQPKSGEQLTLTNIRLNMSSLEADAKFPSDSFSVVNHLVLSRQNAAPGSIVARDDRLCGQTPNPQNLRRIFAAYQMKCPINIGENQRWYKFKFLEDFLAALAGEVIGAGIPPGPGDEEFIRKPVVISWNQSIMILTPTEQNRDQIREALRPLVEDPQNLRVEAFESAGLLQSGAVHVFPLSALKPSLKKGNHVEADKVWAEIVNAALPLSISLDGKSETKTDNNRTIKQTAPRRIPDSEGYIYFEYVTVSMQNYRDKEDALSVNITSKIVKRKGFSSFTQSVNCDLVEPKDFVVKATPCSELPYMKAIIKALTGQE